jgi:hypothetical protein
MSLDAELCGDRRIKGLARKLVRRIDGEGPLPSEIEVPATPEEWEAIAEVGRILGVAAYQKGRKAVFCIPSERRDPSEWDDVRAVFAKKEPGDDLIEETFRRVRLIAGADVVETLKADATVVRFLRRGDGAARDFIRMLEWSVGRIAEGAKMSSVTLSQLGADILGDSKSLRAGTRRMVLERVLCAVVGKDADECGHEAFVQFGIEENPFTSFVMVFAPFSFTLDTGETFRYPAEMFRAGLAVQLPRQTVMRIRNVRLDVRQIVTSENAAPFETLVREKVPCLYTEGYPNGAVIRLLELFAAQGMTADHAGDGDLDGFLIADRISKAITVRRVIADELAADEALPRRPVSSKARSRWEAYLAEHPDFAHASSLRIAMERGWIEQESMDMNVCIEDALQGDKAE